MAIEKLKPMMRPRSVRVAATMRSRSWRTPSSISSCRLRNKTPIRTESHIIKKERAKTRYGDLIRLFMCCSLVYSSGHLVAYFRETNRIGIYAAAKLPTLVSANYSYENRLEYSGPLEKVQSRCTVQKSWGSRGD